MRSSSGGDRNVVKLLEGKDTILDVPLTGTEISLNYAVQYGTTLCSTIQMTETSLDYSHERLKTAPYDRNVTKQSPGHEATRSVLHNEGFMAETSINYCSCVRHDNKPASYEAVSENALNHPRRR